MIYDVLNEAWIPLEGKDGRMTGAGIREALARAHEYRAVRAANPMLTYGIQRVLLALLMDALRPADTVALKSIIRRGSFDAEALEGYYALCRESGERFDLFDGKYPFLQTAFTEQERASGQASAGSLFQEWPTGNNHIHFNHRLESEQSFSPERCLQALCAISGFQMSFGTSRYCSINGAPPLYFLFSGESLFETLACSMISLSQLGNLPFDQPPVAWRDTAPVGNKQPIAQVSLLSGLTAQPLRVQLLPEASDDGIAVRRLCQTNGWDYKPVVNWREPYAVYKENAKKEPVALQPTEGRAVWRDIGTVVSDKRQMSFLSHIDDKLDALARQPSAPSLRCFGVISQQKGAMLMATGWLEEELSLYRFLLEDEEKSDFLSECMACMEDVNGTLAWVTSKNLRQLAGESARNVHGRYQYLTQEIQTLYLADMKALLYERLLPVLRELKPPLDLPPVRAVWGGLVLSRALGAFGSAISQLAQSGALLRWRAAAEKQLYNTLRKKLMKGGWQKDEHGKDGKGA